MSSAETAVAAGITAQHGCKVLVKSSTWARERGDLFDFEASPGSSSSRITIQDFDFEVGEAKVCVRNGANVDFVAHDQVPYPSSDGSEHLVSLVKRNDALWIHQGSDAGPGCLRPSLVVRDLPGGSHVLRSGDTIRLGCARIRVRQVVLEGPALLRPRLKMDGEGPPCIANPEPAEIMEGKTCRICMLEGPNEDDPLVAPCNCKGSVEYVHLGCLREWIRVRRSLPATSEPCDGFEYHPLTCDLCKGPYASGVRQRQRPGEPSAGESEPLAELPFVRPPFVVLEVPGRHYGGSGKRSHALSLAGDGDKTLRLGRAHNCQLRIPDASISRWHASIRFHEGRVLLEDHESKFGTLVEVQRPVAIDPTRAVSLQVGRTVLQLSRPEAPSAVQVTPAGNAVNSGRDLAQL